ncbi:site-specific integrase [Shewanella sp. UCD-KL21]|uniref:site-specific integrase n=1 Tax=Shewanella sp. UCD-KL21 TaxID=1917164 RepID=UPI0009705C76|nr:site-specific integrase [Shewanella sp. UCD-KL21]
MAVSSKINATSIKNLTIEDKRLNDTEIKGFHARISAKGAISYYLFYRHNGKQVNYLLGKGSSITPTQARDMAKSQAGKVASGINVQSEKKAAKAQEQVKKFNKFSIYVEDKYYPWLVANSTRTADQIKSVLLNRFKELGDLQLADITAWHVEQWRAKAKDAGKAEATINYNVNTLKGALSRAVEWGIIDSHELSKVKAYKLDNNRTRYLTPVEEAALLNGLTERDSLIKEKRISANEHRLKRGYPQQPTLSHHTYADHIEPIVLLAMNTGMRRGEILSLKWSNIDFSIPVLTIKGESAKSGKTRHIPLNTASFNVLSKWREQSYSKEFVFEGAEGKPLTDFKKGFNKVIVDAGIHNFNFHDLRHHFASKLVMKGVDLNTVRELLGHADMTMTLRYAHLAPEHKAAAVNLIG